MLNAANSIKFRLGAGYALFTLLLLAALSLTLHGQLRKDIEQQAYKAVENSGTRITSDILQQLAVAKTIANNIANFAASTPYQLDTYKQTIPALVDIPGSEHLIAGGGFWPEPYSANETKERASLFWGRGINGKLAFYNDYNDPTGAGYHHEEWYEPARYLQPGSCYWSRSYIDPYSNQPMVTCTTAIYKDNRFVGAATVDVKLEGITERLALQTRDTGGYAFIVDQNGAFISFPNTQMIFEFADNNETPNAINDWELAVNDSSFSAIAQSLAASRKSLLQQAALLPEYNVSNSTRLARSYQITKAQADTIQVSLIDPLKELTMGELLLQQLQLDKAPLLNEPVNVNVYHVPQTYWKLVFVTPRQKDLAAATAIIKNALLYLSIPVIILALIYWFLLHYSVISPVQKITQHIRDSGTSREAKPIALATKEPNELRELVDSYNERSMQLSQALTQLSEMNLELSHQAHHDPLTGLGNRREFEERLELLSESPQWNNYALLMLDLDRFKVINDLAGHMAGDRLLCNVADILSSCLRNNDYLARLSGDEFAILLRVDKAEAAVNLAERLRIKVDQYRQIENKQVFDVSTSIGIVHLSSITPPDPSEAMKHADKACYMAKDRGRNRAHLYTTSDEDIAKREGEMNWLSEINLALEEDRFFIELQRLKPLNNRKGKAHAAEALVRLYDQEGNRVPPGAFLPAAERFGVAAKIDSRAAELALRTIADNPRLAAKVDYISINLSSDSLQNEHLAENMFQLLEKYSVSTDIICLEVTETGVIQHLEIAKGQLEKLRKAGIRIALDDFGAGMSSYGYLRNLPVDIIKIDGSFVKSLDEDPVNQAFVKSMHEVSSVMGLSTVAEFVENTEIEKILHEIGITYAQGYGIAKPSLPDDFIEQTIGKNTTHLHSVNS